MAVSVGEKTARLSFGEALRPERELRRIPLREVAESTKINIRYLEALERNDFAFLPAGAFTRGFIRSYSRFVGTDETEMLNAYMDELRQQERHGAPPRGESGGAAGPPAALGALGTDASGAAVVFTRYAARARAGSRRTLLISLIAVGLVAAAGALGLSYIIDSRAAAAGTAVQVPAEEAR